MDQIVYIVDDDQAARQSLGALLEVEGYPVHYFEDGASFLSAVTPTSGGCVLLDVHMPGLTGHDVQAAMIDRLIGLPVIIITGHGDVPMAVKAMKGGAFDFIEKPYRADHLLERVDSALTHDAQRRQSMATSPPRHEIERRRATLTQRESEVMEGVVQGLMNKQIAGELGISDRTVEIHRARVMDKMQARSLAELIRLSLRCEGH